MTIPDYQTLMLPVLREAAAGETRVPEVAQRIADNLGLTAEERDVLLPSGRQRLLHNRIHWAKFYMGKAGLIDNRGRGKFIASDDGRALLATRPVRIDVAMLKGYPAFSQFYERSEPGSDKVSTTPAVVPSPSTPEEQIDLAHAAIQQALEADLLQRILQQSPAFFERLIVELLVAMGYGGSHERAAQNLGKSGDGGVDGVIDEDRLRLDRVYVQAKRYSPELGVGRQAIQGFVGSLVGLSASKGVFVTTSYFSSHALEYVRRLPQRVVLIDGRRLTELLIEHDVGVRVHRTIAVKRLDEDFFADE